jgi:hypothetical protein
MVKELSSPFEMQTIDALLMANLAIRGYDIHKEGEMCVSFVGAGTTTITSGMEQKESIGDEGWKNLVL